MTVKEWLKKNKKKLAIAGAAIGSGIAIYSIAQKNNIRDIPKPDWPMWDLDAIWTQKNLPESVCVSMSNVPIADIGTLGEKLISDCGAPLNAVVDLNLFAYKD